MHHWKAEFRRAECAGHGRVGVALHQHQIGPFLQQNWFEPGQNARRLFAMLGRTDAEGVTRRRQAQLLEEDGVNFVGIVLARMHQNMLEPLFQQRNEW